MLLQSKLWIRLGLINLCIVALLGTVMRYKICFELPFIDQKYLQEAHSHFAFTGWITHMLFFLLVMLFSNNLNSINEKLYRGLILANLFCAYGMLISFAMQGYGPVSITFSTLSILTAYVFSFYALKDAGRLQAGHPSKNWIKAAIWLGILSTLGTIILSHMMATRQYNQTTYLGSIFFYLHFQYNGWFLFACIALFMDRIKHLTVNPKDVHYSFWLFFLAGVPAYFLSTLWARLPAWLYGIVVLAAILQLIGWWFIVRIIQKNIQHIKKLFPSSTLILFLIAGSALTIKLLLQLSSTIPVLSKLAFGFRPVVIAYLHLVLLLIVSMSLLALIYSAGLLKQNLGTRIPMLAFASGAILNEMALSTQGIAAFSYTIVPMINEILFFVALLLLFSSIFLLIAQLRSSPN